MDGGREIQTFEATKNIVCCQCMNIDSKSDENHNFLNKHMKQNFNFKLKRTLTLMIKTENLITICEYFLTSPLTSAYYFLTNRKLWVEGFNILVIVVPLICTCV